MPSDLPKRPSRHVSGDRAVVVVRRDLPAAWIVREQPAQTDYGIDLEVEIADANVTGRIFKGQVRGHAEIGWSSGSYLQPVRAETLNYWRAIPVPVVVLVVDHGEDAAYWALSRTADGDRGVVVPRANRLESTSAELRDEVLTWLQRRGAHAALLNVPLFAHRWNAAQERLERDCFLSVDEDDYAETLWLYRQVELLRQALGLSYADILPWALWVARSRVTFGDEQLYWGTYDEIIAYLKPLVDEALEAATKRFRAEEVTIENAIAKSWAESRAGMPVVYLARSSLEGAERSFWEAIDERLKQSGALRYRAAKGRIHGERNR